MVEAGLLEVHEAFSHGSGACHETSLHVKRSLVTQCQMAAGLFIKTCVTLFAVACRIDLVSTTSLLFVLETIPR